MADLTPTPHIGAKRGEIAEKVEAQVRANLIQGNATREPAKAAVRPIAISADDFDDED